MGVILIYGLDEAGETTFRGELSEADRPRLREVAREHLERHAAVEVWDGQICVVRVKRPGAGA